MSSSNCCLLTCIQISQEAGQVVWYSHLFQNFPQLIVIHTVQGFGIVNKAEIDASLELSCFFHDPADVGNFSPQRMAIIDLLRVVEVITNPPSLRVLDPESNPELGSELCKDKAPAGSCGGSACAVFLQGSAVNSSLART